MPKLKSYSIRYSYSSPAFTITELLVVIVIIGILAAITVVSYIGITQRAVQSSLQSDLANASQQLKMFQVDNGYYPTTISTNCVTQPDSSTNKCIKTSPGNTYSNYVASSSTINPSFSLTSTNTNNTSFYITDSSQPRALTAAPLNPTADWLATLQGDHYGNFYDLVTHSWSTVTRSTPKTIYDPATSHIYDVPANYLAVSPRNDGQAGYESAIEESRTNYLLQSSFENTMSGWTYQIAGYGNATSSSDKSVYGSNSLKVTRTATGSEANVYQNLSGLASSTTYYYSAWTWADSTSSACIFTYNATTNLNTTCNSGGSKWERIGGTFVSSATGTVQLRLGNSGTALTSSYFDAVQVEAGTSTTSYIPTTITPVTRNADIVTIPTTNWNSNTGTLLAVDGNIGGGAGNNFSLVSWRQDGTNAYSLYRCNNTTVCAWAGTGPLIYNSAGSRPNGYNVDAMTWAPGVSVYTYENGVGVSSSNFITPSTMPATATIGSYAGGSYWFNGPIQRLIVYTLALSSVNISTIDNTIQNGI